jgi:hypothetical protein
VKWEIKGFKGKMKGRIRELNGENGIKGRKKKGG